MQSRIEVVLRMDLTAIAAGYNVPRSVAIPILERAVMEMRRMVEARGEVIRRTDKM